MRSLRSLFCSIVLVLVSACGGAPLTPEETVGLYLKGMKGKDPLRVLSVLTADFHRKHRMVFANTADLPDGIVLSRGQEGMSDDPEWAAERGRLGWLVSPLQGGRAFEMFPGLLEIQLGWGGSEVRGDRAQVRLRAWVPDDASVTFTFELERRAASEPWRIDAVDAESDSSPHARLIHYLIAPDLDDVQFIRQEAALRDIESP